MFLGDSNHNSIHYHKFYWPPTAQLAIPTVGFNATICLILGIENNI